MRPYQTLKTHCRWTSAIALCWNRLWLCRKGLSDILYRWRSYRSFNFFSTQTSITQSHTRRLLRAYIYMCRKTNAEHVYEMRIKSTWKLGHKFAGKSTHVIRVISLAMANTQKITHAPIYIFAEHVLSTSSLSPPPPPKSQMLSTVIGPYVRVFCILRQLQLHLDGTRWRQSLFTLRLLSIYIYIYMFEVVLADLNALYFSLGPLSK